MKHFVEILVLGAIIVFLVVNCERKSTWSATEPKQKIAVFVPTGAKYPVECKSIKSSACGIDLTDCSDGWEYRCQTNVRISTNKKNEPGF